MSARFLCLDCKLLVTSPCVSGGCDLRALKNDGDSFSKADGFAAVLDFGPSHAAENACA